MNGGAKPIVERAYMVMKRLAASSRSAPRTDRRARSRPERHRLEDRQPAHRPLSRETVRLTEKGAVFHLGPDHVVVADRYASSLGPQADVVILHGLGSDDRGVRRRTRAVQVGDVERHVQADCTAVPSIGPGPGYLPATDRDCEGCPVATSPDAASDC